jgi:hypothetical protein
VFDEPNLVSSAGLVSVVALADSAGLRAVAEEHVTVPTNKGANAELKVALLLAGMVAGVDRSTIWRCCTTAGSGRCSRERTPPSTLSLSFGHSGPGMSSSSTRPPPGSWSAWQRHPVISGIGEMAIVDIDDTIG